MVKKGGVFCLALILLFIFVDFALSVNSPASSQSPLPVIGTNSPSPSHSPISLPPAPNTHAPTPVKGPVSSSPPARSPAPASSPSLSPSNSPEISSVPSPAPSEASEINYIDYTGDGIRKEGSGGMSGGKKTEIAVGVVVAACVVGFGGMVYKKRQENIRRSRYSYTTTRDFF